MKDVKTTEYEFGVGSKVFYPTHGAGFIKAEKNIEFQGEKQKYFEFAFIDAQLTVSTPVGNVNKLGVRPVMSAKEINSQIKILKTKPALKHKFKDYNELITHIEELDLKGDVDAYIEIIRLCNYVRKIREKEGRLIPVSINKYAKSSVNHLIAELAVTLDTDLESATTKFSKTTGIELP